MGRCHFCKAEVPSGLVIGHDTLCSSCGKPLKICFNCRFYDKDAYHECREEIDEPVLYKDVANYCDHFVMNDETNDASDKSKEEARSKFLSLFKD